VDGQGTNLRCHQGRVAEVLPGGWCAHGSGCVVTRAEKQLEREQRDLEVREARVRERERGLARRETSVTVAERRLAGSLPSATRTQRGSAHKVKLGRNEPCWCDSGKKYKNCHLASDQSD
jgi:uncharacterized protein YchJ